MNLIVEQISIAILNGKDFYKNIKLPSPQKSGSTYQIRSFAKQCATKIFEEHFKYNSP